MKKKREKFVQFGGKHRVKFKEKGFREIEDYKFEETSRLNDSEEEVVELFKEAYATLTEKQQQVLNLLVDQRCTVREAAKIMKVHSSVIQEHLASIRKKLLEYAGEKMDLSLFRLKTKEGDK